MQKSIIKKGLVFGIIVLFIGIGVQPAFAIDVSNVKPSDNIEDCDCQVKDNYNLEKYKTQISKLETYSNLLLILSKNNPEFEHFFKSLSRLGAVIPGNIDVILFNNHNNDDKGVITLTRRPGKDGNARIFGQITYDEEKYNYFYEREVKGIGQS